MTYKKCQKIINIEKNALKLNNFIIFKKMTKNEKVGNGPKIKNVGKVSEK